MVEATDSGFFKGERWSLRWTSAEHGDAKIHTVKLYEKGEEKIVYHGSYYNDAKSAFVGQQGAHYEGKRR